MKIIELSYRIHVCHGILSNRVPSRSFQWTFSICKVVTICMHNVYMRGSVWLGSTCIIYSCARTMTTPSLKCFQKAVKIRDFVLCFLWIRESSDSITFYFYLSKWAYYWFIELWTIWYAFGHALFGILCNYSNFDRFELPISYIFFFFCGTKFLSVLLILISHL